MINLNSYQSKCGGCGKPMMTYMESRRTPPTKEFPNGQQMPRSLHPVYCDSICETNYRNKKDNTNEKNITHEYDQFLERRKIEMPKQSGYDITTGEAV